MWYGFISDLLQVFGFTVSYLPILLVILDVTNGDSTSELFKNLWFGETLVQVILVFGLFPFFIVYYEGNEEDAFVLLNNLSF